MNKPFTACLALSAGLYAATALAAPGELWEITSKTEMPGMPFAIPATTMQVCLPKDGASDPRQSTSDKSCQMTDIRQSGNKTSWKMRCDHNGEIMNGTGEQTTTASSYQGTMHLNGKSGGKTIDMTTRYSGKNLGKSCDASQPGKQAAEAQQQTKQGCDISGRSTAELVNMSDMFLSRHSMCASKREAFCSAVRSDAAKDADAYAALASHDQNLASGGVAVARACGVNMAAATTSICKTLDARNYRTLSPYCPKQAKAWRVAKLKQECEGYNYASQEELKKCLGGDDSKYAVKDAPSPGSSKSSRPADAAAEGAKKLKGMFGF